MSLEPVLVLLLLLVPLVEWILRRVREASANRQPGAPQPPLPSEPPPLPQPVGRDPFMVAAPEPAPARTARPPRPRVGQSPVSAAPSRRALRRRELRRAVVLMTLLNPPRAIEPYDDRLRS